TAIATASAASGCVGTSASRWTRTRAMRICDLSAAPEPVIAFFTSSEPYSSTGTPASAASAMTTPVALATAIALALFTFQATRSSARDSGRCSAIVRRTASAMAWRRSASGAARLVSTVAVHTMTGLRSRRATTARPRRATPGSIPSTQVSNICSCSLWSLEGPGNHSGASQRGHDLLGDVEVRVDRLHVVQVFERFDQPQHLPRLSAIHRDRRLRQHRDLGGGDRNARLPQGLAHGLDRDGVGGDLP